MNIESIVSKLKKYSKEHKKIHQYTIIRFFQERFLYRLSQSRYKDFFLLKGGALVYVFGAEESRYTKDIDLLLTKLESEHENLLKIFKEISQIQSDDGIIFDTDQIIIETIQKEGQYTGTRIRLGGKLGNIKQQLQIDIGVGDYVTPGPQEIVYPTLISGFEEPILNAYSKETLIAEKFEAMISLGEYNSRMKDFYDVYQFVETSDLSILFDAIKNTFIRRKATVVVEHPVFMKEFYENDKRKNQWSIFIKKNELNNIDFDQVLEKMTIFLKPIYDKLYLEIGKK
ncbi:nucleotidyl transferase AbiEii/AbiGii toxin family protein [Lewinella sp. LCG006]|uniref:nucleotidyl transferase AbiEii/AbiGii toxin family protein n=1 Tax=Lewinella sp. LCG006 TaxID=3231911 RepID=UPI00345FB3E1